MWLENHPYLLPIIVIVFWVLLISVFSRFGGWRKLAKLYIAKGKFEGEKKSYQTIRVGLHRFKNVVTVGFGEKTLYLSLLKIFRCGYPSLEIPLNKITGIEHRGFLFTYVELEANDVPGVMIRFTKKMADRLEQSSQGAWTYTRCK